jgi:hypothetical protein
MSRVKETTYARRSEDTMKHKLDKIAQSTAAASAEEGDLFLHKLNRYLCDDVSLEDLSTLQESRSSILKDYKPLQLTFSQCCILYDFLFKGTADVPDVVLEADQLFYLVDKHQKGRLQGSGVSRLSFFFAMLHDIISDWDSFPLSTAIEERVKNGGAAVHDPPVTALQGQYIGQDPLWSIAQARKLYLQSAAQLKTRNCILYFHFKNNNQHLQEYYPENIFLTQEKLVTAIQLFLREPAVDNNKQFPSEQKQSEQSDTIGGPYWYALREQDKREDEICLQFTDEHTRQLMSFCLFGE